MNDGDATLVLRNGRIIDPATGLDRHGDLLISGSTIVAVGTVDDVPADARILDVDGCWVVPGLIDMHVHLREPGEEYKETIESGCRAAAAGGFTAVACMPNTKPVNDCKAITTYILARAAAAGCVRVYPVAAISKCSAGVELAEYGELRAAGAVAVSDDGLPVMNSQLMRRALEYAATFNMLVISHAEDANLAAGGVMNEGATATRLGLRGIPASAETVMVYRDLALAELTGARLHIAHVSTAEAVACIRRAKERGVPVTAETAPHYFTLTEEAVDQYDTNAKMNPPLRTDADVEAIRQGLADGTLDAIATDHAPHSILEKEVEFDRAANGIVGLETAVPLALDLVRKGILDAAGLVRCLSTNPARILGVPGGSLAPGGMADVTVIDPEEEYTLEPDNLFSKGKNSPFLSRPLKGRAVLTIVGGVVRHDLLG